VQWTPTGSSICQNPSKDGSIITSFSRAGFCRTSIVAFGSLARNEFTQGSDIDWTLLIDGQAASEHLAIANKVRDEIARLEGKGPGKEGILATSPLAMTDFMSHALHLQLSLLSRNQ
jgi:Nucleotidyltransferase domain